MIKIFLFVLLGVVIAGSIATLAGLPQRIFTGGKPGLSRAWTKPWIEVLRPQAEGRDFQSGKVRELRTGDEIAAGRTVVVDANGRSNLYFPDGSVLRMDSGTEIQVRDSEFNGPSEKSITRITLSAGRIWSKVLALVTPDSVWEVRTSNAVVTVRGTAFGIFFRDGKTSVVGSESSVKVAAVDPATGRVFEAAAVLVQPNTFVEIGAEEIAAIKEEKAVLAAKAVPADILAEEWIREAKREDEEYDKRLKELRSQGLEGQTLREEFRKKIREELEKKREEGTSGDSGFSGPSSTGEELDTLKGQKIEQRSDELRRKPSEETKGSLSPEKEESSPPPPGLPLEKSVPPTKLVSLAVKSAVRLEKIIEGARIPFTAILVLSDGMSRDVTAEAKWSVHGDIGKMEKPGIFFASLGPSVSELGIAPGAISAVWRDPQSGIEFVGKTAVFNVEAGIETIIDTRG